MSLLLNETTGCCSPKRTGVLEPLCGAPVVTHGEYFISTCLSHGTQVRRKSFWVQYKTHSSRNEHALRSMGMHEKVRVVLRTTSHHQLVQYLYVLAFTHAHTSSFGEGGDDTGNFGFASTGVKTPMRHPIIHCKKHSLYTLFITLRGISACSYPHLNVIAAPALYHPSFLRHVV